MFARTAIFVLYLGLAACSRSTPPSSPTGAAPAPEQATSTQTQQIEPEETIETTTPNLTELSLTARWDTATTAKADFNSDGLPDEAVVGYLDDGLLLAIDVGGSDGAKTRSLMSFGIGQSQDSICAAPATLRIEVAHCSVEGEDLPGCRTTEEPSGLALGDQNGDCDAIHLYWDHQERRMSWWRH